MRSRTQMLTDWGEGLGSRGMKRTDDYDGSNYWEDRLFETLPY